ncbi:TVP38/TMEM64 family protein [Virgibacillus oceani]|uniref:TVP38/TMEM64 family membrane protein n=1 Tax=Virgibacillus oceani TaxID=1479511 RepID=A0A917H7G4_9BACI|nr:VTT domain-containing protein [Virgibacillus oceani]GGG69501.1 TVP38/TMEM64 family protein [Virgibacillus oceani]
MKKFFTIAIYTLLVILLFINKDVFLAWIRSGDELSIIISMLFFALLVFFPVVPFVVAAGIIGASFGVILGTAIILSGVIAGTIIMFLMARYGFQDWVQRMLDKFPKIKNYKTYFEQNAFIGILGLRIVPIIPSPLVNILCGITKVRLETFIVASLLGKLPRTVIFTIAGIQVTQNTILSIAIYAVYFLLISILVTWKMKQQTNVHT